MYIVRHRFEAHDFFEILPIAACRFELERGLEGETMGSNLITLAEERDEERTSANTGGGGDEVDAGKGV